MINPVSNGQSAIPKVIHYSWFGTSQPSDLMKRCIDSWSSQLPQYQIVRWSDLEVSAKSAYAQAAVEARNWGNLSNLLRYAVLYRYGGIYLDVDVEVLKSFDPLLENRCFFGCQQRRPTPWTVNSAVMGAVPGHWFVGHLLRCLMSDYSGQENASTTSVYVPSTELMKCGLKAYSENPQKLDDITIYPTHYFHPVSYERKDFLSDWRKQAKHDSYSVHYWENSWLHENTPPVLSFRNRAFHQRVFHRVRSYLDRALQFSLSGRKQREFITQTKNAIYGSICDDFNAAPLLQPR
jgi:mannosyltransferase OCH1-like enzyme